MAKNIDMIVQRASSYKELNLSLKYIVQTLEINEQDIKVLLETSDVAEEMMFKIAINYGWYYIIYSLWWGFVRIVVYEWEEDIFRFNEQLKSFPQLDIVRKLTGFLLDKIKTHVTTNEPNKTTTWSDDSEGAFGIVSEEWEDGHLQSEEDPTGSEPADQEIWQWGSYGAVEEWS